MIFKSFIKGNVVGLKLYKSSKININQEIGYTLSSIIEKKRSPAISNLLGVCRASKKDRTDKDIYYALKDFEAAFNKDNFGEISLDALCNHIKLCTEMGRKESAIVNNLIVSEKMYSDASKKFSNNERYLAHGIDLYKYLLKHKERISKIEELLKFKKLNKLFGTVYITSQMYLSNWRQKDFGDFQKKFSKVFSSFDAKKLSKIDTKKKILILDFYLLIFVNLIQYLIL